MILFGEVNIAFLDLPWSAVHFISGLTTGAVLSTLAWLRSPKRFWLAGLAALVLWELVEMTLRYLDHNFHEAIAPFKWSVAGFAFAPESTLNTLSDLVIGAIGLAIGRRVRF